MLETNPDALDIAASLDAERASGNVRGPLHGIPFVSKDNFYTNDKHNTSEGGLVLLGGKYIREATAIHKARKAGMVLLGHAALSEAADHRALSGFSDGYSTRGGTYSVSRTTPVRKTSPLRSASDTFRFTCSGQTRNPYNFTQATSGSSGGSAVAVAANLAPVALGTETHGSVVHPAAQLGVVGIKATPGLISRTGVVPGSECCFSLRDARPSSSTDHSAALSCDRLPT